MPRKLRGVVKEVTTHNKAPTSIVLIHKCCKRYEKIVNTKHNKNSNDNNKRKLIILTSVARKYIKAEKTKSRKLMIL